MNKDRLSQTTGAVVLCVVAQTWFVDQNDNKVKDMIKEIK